MAITTVACPYCGAETLATVPAGKTVATVSKREPILSVREKSFSDVSCPSCGKAFIVYSD